MAGGQVGGGGQVDGQVRPEASHGLLDGRIALITGASRGIGRAVALRYAEEGADLVLAARTQGGLEELDDAVRASGRHAALVVGDLTEPGVIERMGAAVYERWGRLDVLVGNASILGTLSPLGHITPETWDRVMAINVTVNWRLIRAFDPLLRTADAGRAMFVTSGVARGRAYWGAYAASKGALETMVVTYAQEIAKTSVRVNLINPGATRTRMRREAYPGEDPNSLKPADDPALLEAFVGLATPDCTKNGDLITV